MENSIKEAIERLKLCSTNQCNICGRYEKEECMLERNRCEQHILSEYKKVLKDKIEELNREIDKSIDNSKGGLDEEFIEKAGKLLAQKRILQELLERRK